MGHSVYPNKLNLDSKFICECKFESNYNFYNILWHTRRKLNTI